MAQLAATKIDLFLFMVVRSEGYIVNANKRLSQVAEGLGISPSRHSG
jgi:hypothetical protein